jgi:hypothetical protein
LVTFTGVYLLNLSRGDPDGRKMLNGYGPDGVGTDMISSIQTRRSMQARRSLDQRHSIGSHGRSDREGLIQAYDEEENGGFGLTDLAEESEDDAPLRSNGKANGHKAKPNLTLDRPVGWDLARASRSPSPRSPLPRSPR